MTQVRVITDIDQFCSCFELDVRFILLQLCETKPIISLL
nr:MAG TPA: hypothetical protein [Microviridae sp.]